MYLILTNYFQVKHIKNLLAHKYFYLWLAEFWTLVIAFLCMVSFKKLPSIGISGADKYVHFTFHFVFTLLWFLYFNTKNKNESTVKLLFKVFLASLFYGIIIEISQSLFTTTRQGDIFDVFANASGSIVAVIIIFIYKYTTKKNSK